MNKSIIIGIVLLAIIAGSTFLFNGNSSSNAGFASGEATKEIRIDAKRFDFTPGTINVNEGEKVKLIVNNMDTLHGIRIPEFGVSGNEIVEFTAPAKGTYAFYCNNFCGEGHSLMSGTIVVS